jgi:hypothetical protein
VSLEHGLRTVDFDYQIDVDNPFRQAEGASGGIMAALSFLQTQTECEFREKVGCLVPRRVRNGSGIGCNGAVLTGYRDGGGVTVGARLGSGGGPGQGDACAGVVSAALVPGGQPRRRDRL